jgi:hypothetical protein
MFRSIGILAGVALLAALAVVQLSPTGAAPPIAATFNTNLLLPGSNGAAEPSIRTNSKGESFVIGPTGSQCQAMRVNHAGSAAKFLGAPDHNAGGGDCDWAVGPKETASLPTFATPTADNLAFSSLDNLVNITTGKSGDDGNTFLSPNPASTQVVGDDRMWMAADPKLNSGGFNTIFMTYHDVSLVDIQLSVSIDGGFTYMQSGPIINSPADVPTGQWEGLGVLAGNELGNIVARRDGSGHLTLYSIFATPDSPADNQAQGNLTVGTTNFNRLYEAIGTVTDPTPPSVLPAIAWRNYEIFHGPIGARYNRIFPVTTVDSAGRVYAFWSDGNHIFTKSDPTGTGNGTAWTATVVTIPNFGADNTAIMPWADALAAGGAPGVVDAVFYGAHGGSGAQPNPQDDANNVWNTYMAQTVDGGVTWTTSKASDHDIHKSQLCIDGLNCNLSGSRDRTLLDFFQVSIDPTNGAADIAFADDHASKGSAVMYYTRQCTGISAKTGLALVNDCKAPPPPPTPPQGNVCPGPQIRDFVGDAPNNYPGGMGQNLDNLDIVSSTFKSTPQTAAGTNIDITLKLKDLEAPPTTQNPNIVSAIWIVYFQYGTVATNNTWYYVRATLNGFGGTAVPTYDWGTWNGSFTPGTGAITGEFHPGPLGTFVFHLPRTYIQSPPDGAHLTNTWANTHASITALGNGVYFTAAADRAPNSSYGSDHIVGTPPCPSTGGGGGGGGGCVEADGGGTTQGQQGGTSSFQSDEDGCKDGDQDSEQMHDPKAGEDFTSTRIDSVQLDSSLNTLTVYGEGVNGHGVPVAFVIVEQPATSTSPGFYSIDLSDGYANNGPLLSGSITV